MCDDEPEQIYRAACLLVSQGISVIPTGGGVSQRAKEPHKQALIASGHTSTNGSRELRASWKPMQTQLSSAEDLQTWYMQTRARGLLGMVTGELSGYVVIDVDLEGLPLLHELGWKPHVISPSGGAHLYLYHPGWFVPSSTSKSKKTSPPGFDMRGDGGYIMFPPSRNRQGFYRRTDERPQARHRGRAGGSHRGRGDVLSAPGVGSDPSTTARIAGRRAAHLPSP